MSHTKNGRQSKRASRGFTLIELMIAVVIVAILLAIAVPSYQQSVKKSRRADGIAALLDLAGRQEKFYAQNSRYTDDIDTAAGLNLGRTTSTKGHYALDVADEVDSSCGDLDDCYLLRAKARGKTDDPDQVQAEDEASNPATDCTTLTLNSLGQRSALKADGTSTDPSNVCW